MAQHKNLTGDAAIHPIMYVQSSDPGAVGANKFWLDTTGGANLQSGGVLKQRDGSNAAWTTRCDLSAFSGTGIAASLIDALGDLIYGSADNTAAKLAGQTTTTKKFLTQTGSGSASAAPAWGVIVVGDLPALTSAQLATILSDETGSGLAVFGTGPTLSNPVVGTQTAGDNSTKAASTAYADNAVAKQPEVLMFAVSDETTAITTGTAKLTFRMPFACSMTALPRANLNTVSSSGNPAIDIKKGGTTIFSTTLTIDASEKTSTTAATPAVLSGGSTSFSDDDEITVNIDTAGTGAKGLKITLLVVRT